MIKVASKVETAEVKILKKIIPHRHQLNRSKEKASKTPASTDSKKQKPSREERGYKNARGKKDDWKQFFKDEEPDFSEEGWARRKPKKK